MVEKLCSNRDPAALGEDVAAAAPFVGDTGSDRVDASFGSTKVEGETGAREGRLPKAEEMVWGCCCCCCC